MIMLAIYLVPIIGIAYVLGSIPFALIVGKLISGKDIRNEGSGNAGASNILRVLGKWPALLVGLLDAGKGVAAVFLAPLASKLCGFPDTGDLGRSFAAIAAGLGHVYPLFAGFRGGKAVATMAGAACALWLPALPICTAVFASFAALTRMASMGSLSAAFSLPLSYFILNPSRVPWNPAGIEPIGVLFTLGFFLILYTHRENLRRLVLGKERKLGSPVEGPGEGPPGESVQARRALSAEEREEAKREAFLRQAGALPSDPPEGEPGAKKGNRTRRRG